MNYDAVQLSRFILSFQLNVPETAADMVLLTNSDKVAYSWPFKSTNVYILVTNFTGILMAAAVVSPKLCCARDLLRARSSD